MKRDTMNYRLYKGFTLLEAMVAITIVGVILSLVLGTIGSFKQQQTNYPYLLKDEPRFAYEVKIYPSESGPYKVVEVVTNSGTIKYHVSTVTVYE